MEYHTAGKNKPLTRNKKSWVVCLIMLAAFLVAFLIWRYFDIRIEKLKSGTVMQIIPPIDRGHSLTK